MKRLILFSAAIWSLTTAALPEEQCHTYAGGSVYPNTEGRASGHSLQWTKAMSKCHYSKSSYI